MSRTRHTHRQLDGERREVGRAFSSGCRYPGDPQVRGFEIYNCRCTLVAAIEGVDTNDGERWSKLPPGMTYQQWKDELAPKPQGNYPVPSVSNSVGAASLDLDKAFPEVRLPKKEYASVMSAINGNYHKHHKGQTISQEIVDQEDGAYLYSFLVDGFNEYRIIDKERIR